MNKKQFLNGIPDDLKPFYEKQINSAIMKDAPTVFPISIFLEGFRVTSHNKLKGRWASTNERKRAVTAFDLAGVQSVSLPKKKRYVEILRLIPPKGKVMDKINRAAGLKWVLDQLTERGFIVDDSEKWVVDEYPERKPEEYESHGILITIKEI